MLPGVEPVLVIVDNRIRIQSFGKLGPGVVAALKAEFEHANPQYARIRSMGHYPPKSEPRAYRTWAEEGSEISFPRGGMQRVRDALAAAGIAYRVSDRRADGEEELDVEYTPPGEVAPYQVEAVDVVIGKQNTILKAPTSARKTSIAMMMIARWKVPTIVLVDDTGLAEQWAERAEVELGIPAEEQGRIYGGEFKIRPFTVALHASVVSRAKNERDRERMTRAFGALIGDEIQGAAASRAYASIDLFPARYRVGISADVCIAGGSGVLMADGSSLPIESVREGDYVQTPIGQRRVIGTMRRGMRRPEEVIICSFQSEKNESQRRTEEERRRRGLVPRA